MARVVYANIKYLTRVTNSSGYLDLSDVLKDLKDGLLLSTGQTDFVLRRMYVHAYNLTQLNKTYNFVINVGGKVFNVAEYRGPYSEIENPEPFEFDNKITFSFDEIRSAIERNNGRLNFSITSPDIASGFNFEEAFIFKSYSIATDSYPTPTSVDLSTLNIDENIQVTIRPYAPGGRIVLKNREGVQIGTFYSNNGNTVVIPRGTIIDTSTPYNIEAYNGISLKGFSAYYSEVYEKNNVTFTVKIPTVTNLSTIGEYWEKPITVNWRSTNQEGYEWEAFYNNLEVSKGSGGAQTSLVIPANTFKGTLPASVRVRTYRTYNGTRYYSSWQELSLRLKDIEATISNLIISGDHWENDIYLSWQSVNQQQFKIEVWKDNVIQFTYTGTTDTRYVIPKHTLAVGAYLVKIFVGYANRFVNSQSKNITLKNIMPILGNLSLSGSNIDYDLILSWESTYQDKALLEGYKGDTRVFTVNLNAETSYMIKNNTLVAGAYTFKIKIAYTSITGDRWTEFKQLNTTLVESLPSIGALQPDGIILDKNTPIKCWWTSQNQSKCILEIVGSGYKYTGTTEKEHIIPQGTLQVGTHTLKLTVTYVTSSNVEKSVVKQSNFIVTGKPNTPTITSNQVFSYNRPVITWDSAEQLGFICVIEDLDGNEIWSSDWQNGLITRIKCMKYLPNGTYKAKVQIMNEFSIKSDFSIQQFTVSANEVLPINLSIEDVEFGNKLIWTNEDAHYQAFYIIRDGAVIAKTEKLEYYDYTCKHGQNTYVIRGVTGNDTYNDSSPVVADLKLPYNTLATLSMKYDCIDSELQRNDHTNEMSHNMNTTTIYLNGREHPIVIIGEHITEEYVMSFVSTDYNKFIAMCDRRETFIHRDREGNVVFLSIANIKLKKDRLGGTYSCTGLRIDYREVIDYD